MEWFYTDDAGEVQGPVNPEEIEEMKAKGTLTNESVINCGTDDWIPIGDIGTFTEGATGWWWFVDGEGEVQGPEEARQLVDWMADGYIDGETYVSPTGDGWEDCKDTALMKMFEESQQLPKETEKGTGSGEPANEDPATGDAPDESVEVDAEDSKAEPSPASSSSPPAPQSDDSPAAPTNDIGTVQKEASEEAVKAVHGDVGQKDGDVSNPPPDPSADDKNTPPPSASTSISDDKNNPPPPSAPSSEDKLPPPALPEKLDSIVKPDGEITSAATTKTSDSGVAAESEGSAGDDQKWIKVTKTSSGVVLKEAKDGTKRQEMADGTVVTQYPDGTKEQINSDGTKLEQKPDGTIM